MKDRVQQDIGAKETFTEWSDIDWKTVMKKVKNLRQRIYRATQEKQWNKVRSLQKLLIRCHSNLLLSVQKVTQTNQGKRTPGVDGKLIKTPQERVKLVNQWGKYEPWKVKPTKRIFIPKANGKNRPLGIPTIDDRIAQAIVKNALEPSWEAQFEENSYGFRPGRGCHDAIEQCFARLKNKCDTWVLDADIKGAFDNISHKFILKKLGQIPGRELIKQWLKAGYMEYLYKMASTKIIRHVKVKGKASPDDSTLQNYWDKRQTKYGRTYFAKGSKLYKIAENQKWQCPVCGEHLFNGENFDTHHKIGVAEGGDDGIENLIHIHKKCHLHIHNEKKKVSKKA